MSEIETKIEEIEQMIAQFNRTELDDMAENLGLDPTRYPTKRTIAEAILNAREQSQTTLESIEATPQESPEVVTMETLEEEPVEEVMPEPIQEESRVEDTKMTQNSVRGKKQAIIDKANDLRARGQDELNSGITSFRDSLSALLSEFEVYDTSFRDSVNSLLSEFEVYNKTDFRDGIMRFQNSVMLLKKEFEDYKKSDYQNSINTLHQSTKKFRKDVLQEYIAQFYG